MLKGVKERKYCAVYTNNISVDFCRLPILCSCALYFYNACLLNASGMGKINVWIIINRPCIRLCNRHFKLYCLVKFWSQNPSAKFGDIFLDLEVTCITGIEFVEVFLIYTCAFGKMNDMNLMHPISLMYTAHGIKT